MCRSSVPADVNRSLFLLKVEAVRFACLAEILNPDITETEVPRPALAVQLPE